MLWISIKGAALAGAAVKGSRLNKYFRVVPKTHREGGNTMRKLLAIIPFAALVLAGCGYQEVNRMMKCAKVVDIKYYEVSFLGIPLGTAHYLVLADGREIDSQTAMRGRDGFGNICTTEYKRV